jgi:hypothetical protein
VAVSEEPNKTGTSGQVTFSPGLLAIKREIRTYRRELPRLLAEGQEGRFALIKGDEVVSVWDTFDDAYQAGRERFGMEAFIAQPIEVRYLTVQYPEEFDPNATD